MNRKLTKSKTNVVLTGTLAGFAEFLGIDPTIVRVIYVFLSLMTAGFPGITLYIVMAILIPAGRKTDNSGWNNRYYQGNSYKKKNQNRKEAEKVEDENWSDF